MPLAYKVIDSAVKKIPDDAELGEKLIENVEGVDLIIKVSYNGKR